MANLSDVRSIATGSSNKSDGGSSSRMHKTRWKNTPLHERCSMVDMVQLKDVFTSIPGGKVMAEEFRDILRNLLNLEYDDDAYKILFMKINTSRNGEIDWEELVSHLILGYFSNDPENQRGNLEPPIMGLPIIMRSRHRHSISRICYCPDVLKDRSIAPMQGVYLTASRDGVINWWSMDMKFLRSAQSASTLLKVRTTWVTDLVCMPDINIIVTSSTERDLRFYDCTAKTFTLKIVIYSWEYMICTMHYHFSRDINEKCLLLCGDAGGYVRVLMFSAIERGPFRNEAGKVLTQIRHVDLQRRPKLMPEMKLVEFPRSHTDWVRQVWYYPSLHCVVSCSTCPDSLLMVDLAGSKTHTMFQIDKGIQCFAVNEENHVLVTGGPDCIVRVWSSFVPTKPSVVFVGHHAGIMSIVLQKKGQRIYSISRDRVIKVWDVSAQICLQTYIDIPRCVGERSPICCAYNPFTRELVVGAVMIAFLVLDEEMDPHHTDGFSHSRAVAKVLYNPLFKVVVSCGLDSIIMCWHPTTGHRQLMIREAHTVCLRGEMVPIEITAACFDPGYQLLLTGARDGSLKVWNFNTGVCLRQLFVEHMTEVTAVFWVEGRIITVGWNRHVTEFEDTGMATTGKSWEVRHSEDVTAAAARPPLSLVTASYNSEMVLWKLETGQPFRRFSCTDPMRRIKMHYDKRQAAKLLAAAGTQERKSAVLGVRRHTKSSIDAQTAISKASIRRVSISQSTMAANEENVRPLAVNSCVFLETRPQVSTEASLMVGLENGIVQAWSDHPAGGYKGSFQATHTAGDYVSAMATDAKNMFLFTGTTAGYLKCWLMANYLTNQKTEVSMPRLRLQFPFLWEDRFPGRAKRAVKHQPWPLLLNSYRAHMRCVTTVAYIDEHKLVFTGSSDYSVRMWRLSGEYVMTLGGVASTSDIKPRYPADVKKVASSTTLKVFQGGEVSRFTPGQVEIDKLRDITERELRNKTYGKVPEEPLLGNHFVLPKRPDRQDTIKLDDSLPTIPVYCHFRMASTQPIRRPPTPPLVLSTRLKKVDDKPKAHFQDN